MSSPYRIFLALVLTGMASTSLGDEVCYTFLGCFNNDPPFDNSFGVLPDLPEVVDPQFVLYTKSGQSPVYLNYLDSRKSPPRTFDPTVPTKFIIHGFANTLETNWIPEITNAFLKQGNYNVILVGWNADFPNYFAAVANTRLVAKAISMVIDRLVRSGLNLSDVHLIGHSLGAHTAGYVGALKGSKIGRITGLDPAGPLFDGYPDVVTLDPTDAMFVDVIHTDGHVFQVTIDGYGTSYPAGHIDFYPNGGEKQPGCVDGINGGIENLVGNLLQGQLENLTVEAFEELACSHGRSYEIFTESINSCGFKAVPCQSYEDFQSGKCVSCGPDGCNMAGLWTQQGLGGPAQFFDTLEEKPLCGHSYVVTLDPSGDVNSLNGKIDATFINSAGREKVELVSQGEIPMEKDKPYKIVFTHNKDLGNVTSVELRYERASWLARRQFKLNKLQLEKIGDGIKFESMFALPFTVKTHKTITISLKLLS